MFVAWVGSYTSLNILRKSTLPLLKILQYLDFKRALHDPDFKLRVRLFLLIIILHPYIINKLVNTIHQLPRMIKLFIIVFKLPVNNLPSK